MTKLRDPDECPHCHAVSRYRVVDSRRRAGGYRRRVQRCRECKKRWLVFLTVIDPRRAVESMTDYERRIYTS